MKFDWIGQKEADDHLILRSYMSTKSTSEQEMYTEVSIDGLNDAIIDYDRARARSATEITISLREIRALLTFHESIGSETELYFVGPGEPLIVEGCGQLPSANGVTTELVLSTLDQTMFMTNSQQPEGESNTQEQNVVPGSPRRGDDDALFDGLGSNEQNRKRARR